MAKTIQISVKSKPHLAIERSLPKRAGIGNSNSFVAPHERSDLMNRLLNLKDDRQLSKRRVNRLKRFLWTARRRSSYQFFVWGLVPEMTGPGRHAALLVTSRERGATLQFASAGCAGGCCMAPLAFWRAAGVAGD
jgi:hypothetical protein